MNQARRIGTILILVGLCLPIVSFAFVDNYSSEESIVTNIMEMEVVLREGKIVISGGSFETTSKKAIPYKYIFGLGVVLVFTGAVYITLWKT
jgi:hypothetical protein